MRRAVLLAMCLALLLPTGRARAISGPIDGVGMLDFFHPPQLPVGSWVKYHVIGSSALGHRDDYTVRIMVAGEEMWWGERCFWIETETSVGGDTPQYIATCVSYDVFSDTTAWYNFQRYIRKTISEIDAMGQPLQQL